MSGMYTVLARTRTLRSLSIGWDLYGLLVSCIPPTPSTCAVLFSVLYVLDGDGQHAAASDLQSANSLINKLIHNQLDSNVLNQ